MTIKQNPAAVGAARGADQGATTKKHLIDSPAHEFLSSPPSYRGGRAMSRQSSCNYEQTDAAGPWIDVEEYIYPSRQPPRRAAAPRDRLDDRGKPKKRFIQFHYAESDREIGTGHGHWEAGAPDEIELYVKPDARNVIHVEGEACADFVNEKLREAGLEETGSPPPRRAGARPGARSWRRTTRASTCTGRPTGIRTATTTSIR